MVLLLVQGGVCGLFWVGTPPVTWVRMEFCVCIM